MLIKFNKHGFFCGINFCDWFLPEKIHRIYFFDWFPPEKFEKFSFAIGS